jgi:hypothetical protein
MASTTQLPPHTDNGHAPERRFRWTRGRIAAAVWVVVMVGFWFYAFVIAPKGSPDILDDPSFATSSEARCAQAVSFIDTLPKANTAKTAAERADTLDQANAELRAMVDDISTLPTGNEHDSTLIGLWLADWRQYVADREEFVRALRTDESSTFGVTARNGQHITKAIDAFAGRNKMASCEVPDDV